MKKLVLIALVALAGHQVYGELTAPSEAPEGTAVHPLQSDPYVAVYGRDSCGWTQNMLERVRNAGMDYRYLHVDDESVADSLHDRMQRAGLSTRRYKLPVVDVNGHLSTRPEFEDVANRYREGI